MSSRSESDRDEGSLEFEFLTGDAKSNGTHSTTNGATALPKDDFVPLEKDPTAVVFKGPERPKHFTKSEEKKSEEKPPQPKPETMSTPSPTAINARRNIERQEREQRAVSTLLGSAATFLLIGILLVGSLAGFGGYVLWKQIKQQSVTISLLQAEFNQKLAQAEDEAKKNDAITNQKIDSQLAVITKLRSENEAQASDIRALQYAKKQQDAIIARLTNKMDETDRRIFGSR